MGRAANRGVPVPVIRGGSNIAAMGNTQNRVRALVDQVLEVMAGEAKAGKRDPAQQFVDDFYAVAPMSRPDYLAQLMKLAGIVPGQQQAGEQGKISFNFNGLFAGAAAVAAQQQGDDAIVVDGSDGVQDGYTDTQPTDW